MKNVISLAGAMLLSAAAAIAVTACSDLISPSSEKEGAIFVEFNNNAPIRPGTILPESKAPIPESDKFILTVSASDGKVIWTGLFGDSPETIITSPGTYTVTAMSCEFSAPLYDRPQYGDTKVVSVISGQTASVLLECAQLNCGLILEPDAAFRSAYPNASLIMKGNGGNLMWNYGETRTAYFAPGMVTVSLAGKGAETVLFSRNLSAQQMLRLKLSATEQQSGEPTTSSGIAIQIDTARQWLSESYTVGGNNPGSNPDNAYSVTQARDHAGEKGVWVQGYIVGVATGTGSFSFTPPFTKNTNIVIGLRSATTDEDYCLSVELPKGNIRDALNLVDNPSRLGRKVLLCGDLVEAYYGIPGLKSPVEFSLQ